MMHLPGEIAYLFRHAILQQVSYQLQPPTERAQLHAGALRVMEELFPDALEDHAMELAEHALQARQAQANDRATRSFGRKEAKYLELAASVARRRFDVGRAQTLLAALAECPFASRETRVRAAREAGEAAIDAGHNEQAQPLLHHALAAARRHKLAPEEARVLLCLARSSLLLGRVPEAMSYGDQARAIAANTRDPDVEFAVLHDIGALLFQRGESMAAIELFDKAVALARKSGGGANLASALNRAGAARIMINRLEDAAGMMDEATEIAERIGDQRLVGAILGNRGVMLRRSGKLNEAVTVYRLALAHNRQFGFRQTEITNLDNLGIVLGTLDRHEEAIETHEAGIRLAREAGLLTAVGYGLLNISLIMKKQGRDDESMASLNESEQILRKAGALLGVGNLLVNRANIHRERGHLYEALRDIVEAQLIFRDLRDLGNYWEMETRICEVLEVMQLHGDVLRRGSVMQLAGRQPGVPRVYEFLGLYWQALAASHTPEMQAHARDLANQALNLLPVPGWIGPQAQTLTNLQRIAAG